MEITRDTSAVTAGMPARMAALVHDRCNRTAMLPTDLRSCFAEELQEMVDRPELYDLRDLPLRVVIGALRLVKAPRLP